MEPKKKLDNFSVLFFIKKQKLLKNGRAPICLRITYNGKRTEMNIRKSILPENWDQIKQQPKHNKMYDEVSCDLEIYLRKAYVILFRIYQKLEDEGHIITPEIVKQQFLTMQERDEKQLIQVFHTHNRSIRKLIGTEYAEITVKRYECITRRLQEFIKKKYDREDILLQDVGKEFITEFIYFLKTDKKCAQNTVIRYMKCFKKIIHMAQANEWITRDPFVGINLRSEKVKKDFLTKEELIRILTKNFTIPRVELVKDIFVFACFSGLSFIDVQQLEPGHIVEDGAGNLWICKNRQKTRSMCHIPLLDIPKKIVEKYKNHPLSLHKGRCLPVPCNQNMNTYLKEISDCCGINKQITTHTARRTFASVVTLPNRVPIESVSHMLGHADLRMTMQYTHIFDENVLAQMLKVNEDFEA